VGGISQKPQVRATSECGTFRTCRPIRRMSVIGGKAAMPRTSGTAVPGPSETSKFEDEVTANGARERFTFFTRDALSRTTRAEQASQAFSFLYLHLTRPHRRHTLRRQRRARLNSILNYRRRPRWVLFSFAVYFLPLASAFVFICASSLSSFVKVDLIAAISARAAARSRPAAASLSCVSRASLVSAC